MHACLIHGTIANHCVIKALDASADIPGGPALQEEETILRKHRHHHYTGLWGELLRLVQASSSSRVFTYLPAEIGAYVGRN